jgi:beta-glucosidase-like glycosyl hydrolase
VIYGIDSIHGANYVRGSTLFPQEIGMAATWNPALMQRVAEITAVETRAAGIPWTFSPVLDLGRQPLWPRSTKLLEKTRILRKSSLRHSCAASKATTSHLPITLPHR